MNPSGGNELGSLWRPLEVGPVTLDNRIFVSAHETNHGDQRRITDRYIEYVAARARGGAGLVMPGGASVHPKGEHAGHLPIWGAECVPGYTKLADRVHQEGGKVFVQLFHCGSQDSGTDQIEDWHAVSAPSALASPAYHRFAHALEVEEIAEIVEYYGRSAVNMRDSGIDGVEIDAAHGYLVCQFLSPLTNRRSDDYGGSLENRARLLREILEQVRARVGPNYPVGIRMSFDEFLGESGLNPQLSEQLITHIHGLGLIDYINVSGANFHTLQHVTPTMSAETGAHFAANAGLARTAVGEELPVFVASGVRTVQQAAEILESGQADLVGMTRAHIADPNIVAKAKAGRFGSIQRCVGANQGCVRRVAGFQAKLTCTVNPVAGRETEWTPRASDSRSAGRRVLVVGGGPAGMKAAATAALRGHEVTLIEREPELGGQLRWARKLATRSRWGELVEDLEFGLSDAGVEVRLDTEVDLVLLAESKADEVIIATGSRFDRGGFSMTAPDRAAIPGADQTHVIDPVQALKSPSAVGHRVVIVDDLGDTIATCLAIGLAESGHEVEIVTAHLTPAANTALTGDLPWLMPRMLRAGVTASAQSMIGEINAEAVSIHSIWGEAPIRTTPADTVVLCMHRTSETTLAHALTAAGGSAVRIGDCVAPREVDEAIYEGMKVGLTVGGELTDQVAQSL